MKRVMEAIDNGNKAEVCTDIQDAGESLEWMYFIDLLRVLTSTQPNIFGKN